MAVRSATSSRPLLLVLRALGLGDLLTALPALRALSDAFPNHQRVLAAPKWLAPLALHSGAVDAVASTAPLAPLAKNFFAPALAVNLHGAGPQSHRSLLQQRPWRLLAFAHPDVAESSGGPAWRAGEHEVHRWCRLLEAYGIATDPTQLDLSPPPGPGPARFRGATVVHAGAKNAARHWPIARWIAVAAAETARGRMVLVTGNADERGKAIRIAHGAGIPLEQVMAGRTPLLDLVALVAAAGRVISTDTGIAHLATALRTPSVVLFGPCSPAQWGPPPDRIWHRALWKGRHGDPHAQRTDRGLLAISVDDVLAALDDLPPGPSSATRREVSAA